MRVELTARRRAVRLTATAVLAFAVAAACADPVGSIAPAMFAAVSAGGEHTCAIVVGGGGYCWGSGSAGQLGNAQHDATAVPRPVELTDVLISLDAGYRHTCGITNGHQLFCWGGNARGQLGNASTVDQAVPTAIAPSQRFQQVTGGWFHTCALTTAGDAYCWGDNGQGQLGDGTTTERLAPVRVAGGLTFTSLSAGGSHTCGVTTDAALYCWGLNNQGQLGTGDVTSTTVPAHVAPGAAFRQVSAGFSHSCALDTAGRPACWGSNARGELGVAFASPPGVPGSMVPAPVRDVDAGFIDIAAGLAFTCAVGGAGTGWCWGLGADGQLGNGSFRSWPTRFPVLDARGFASISAGSRTHVCGITVHGAILCWGRGDSGQLGNPSSASSPRPVRVPGVTG